MVPIEQLLSRASYYYQRTGRPFVTLSYAQSLDGSIALRRNHPLGLSGSEALKITHQLRAAHDVILVGIGTVISDNPQLTVRMIPGKDPQPVILDSHWRLPLTARVFDHPKKPWIAGWEGQKEGSACSILESKGAKLLFLPFEKEGYLSLDSLLRQLASLEVKSIMVEGGARIISSFLQSRFVNQIVLTISPCFVGGLRSIDRRLFASPLSGGFPRLNNWECERAGDDLIIWGTVSEEGQ